METLERPWYQKKKVVIPLAIIVFLIALRMVLQPILLSQINKKLSEVNPVFSFHADDLSLSIIRASATLEGISGKIKKSDKEFLKVDEVTGSIAWMELLKGKVVSEVVVDGAHLTYSNALKNAAARMPKKKEEATDLKQLTKRFRLEKFEVKDSDVTLADYPGLEKGTKLKVEDINVTATNVLGTERNPLAFFNARASVAGLAPVKSTGQFDIQSKPPRFTVDSKMEGLDLTQLNQSLRQKIPLNFKHGTMSFYAEAQTEGKKIVGYIKPFFKDLNVIGNKQEFKGPKHFLIEAVTALGDVILRAEDKRSVATKVPFSIDQGGFHIDTGTALSKTIQHGYEQRLSPGIENQYELKQAQEEK